MMTLVRRDVVTTAELGPVSQADFQCPECGTLLSIYSDWSSSVLCDCGYKWSISIEASGYKWTDPQPEQENGATCEHS